MTPAKPPRPAKKNTGSIWCPRCHRRHRISVGVDMAGGNPATLTVTAIARCRGLMWLLQSHRGGWRWARPPLMMKSAAKAKKQRKKGGGK